jgi:hypothetical protein
VVLFSNGTTGTICLAYIHSEILKKQPTPRIIAMNHRTDVDVMGVWHLRLCVLASPYIGRIIGWFQKVGFNLEVIFTRKEQTTSSDDQTRKDVRDSICTQLKSKKGYLYSHPEGATTNGKGILVFNKFIFGLGEEVQPVALNFYIPLFDYIPVHVDHLFDNWVSNFFFILFHPCVVYEFTFLSPQVIASITKIF